MLHRTIVSPDNKMSKAIKLALLTGCSVICLMSEIANAQDANSETQADTDVITVTANKREQNLQDVAASVVNVDPGEFKTQGLTDLSDLIDYTPGITLRSNGVSGTGSISARGVPQSSSIPVTGIYVDDVPFTSNSGYAAGSIYFYDGLLGDIERIEIVKGPQGTLYGANAVGGVVKYISRDPALDEIRGEVGVDLSTTHRGGLNQIYNGRISAPIIEDRVGVTIAGFVEDRKGYVDVIDPGTEEILHKDANTSDRFGLSADLLVKLGERASLKFKGLHQETDWPLSSQVFLAGMDSDEGLFGPYTTINAPAESSLMFRNYAGTFDYEFDWATFTSVTSFVKYEQSEVSDLTAAFADFIDGAVLGNPLGTTTSVLQIKAPESEKVVQEFRLTSNESDVFEWIVGLYYTNEDTIDEQGVAVVPEAVVGSADLISEYKELAVFGNATYYFTDDFDFTYGGRISNNQLDLTIRQGGPLLGLGPEIETTVYPKAEQTVDTHMFAFRYRPSEDMSIYAKAASGFRPSSGNFPLVHIVTGEDLAPPVLAADTLWSYELGVKGKLGDGLFTYDVAIWQSDWNNFQSSIFHAGVTSARNYMGKLRSKGFDGAIGLNPVEGFNINLNATYTDSELNNDDEILGAVKGERYPNVPKWTVAGQTSYTFGMSDDVDMTLKGGFRHVGKSLSSFTMSPTSHPVLVNGYTVADVSASITNGTLTGTFYVANLTNEAAIQNRNDGILTGASTAIFTRPRTIGVNLGFEF